MRIYQFTAIQPQAVTARLIRASAGADTTVVLDLEDSLWDVDDEARTAQLKAAGRAALTDLARSHANLFAGGPIGVRINRISGPEAALDIDALAQASRTVTFDCIVTTKVETAAEITTAFARLREARVAFRTVIPIVETRRGIAALDEIAAAAAEAGLRSLCYGHFDYALDAGWWPIPDPREPDFWSGVEPLIRQIESAGLAYVHPPYFETRDGAGLGRIVERLTKVCGREFGLITVGPRQSAQARRTAERGAEPSIELELDRTVESPTALARRITASYLAGDRRSASFLLDPASGRFISPHVYLAAREYLRRTAGE
jgi:citrate lyase beta subunit